MSDNTKKAVSIKTLAAYLNMSHATVSRALNDKAVISEATKDRVREAAEKFGYVVNAGARLVRGMRGSLVGLIIPDVQNDFYSTVAKILAQSCMHEGLELILAISDDDSALEAMHIRSMLEARVAGIIITPTIELKAQEAQFLKTVPCVQLARKHDLIKADHMSIDDRLGVKLATRHLLELGHRRIGFIGGSEQLSTSVNRISGYKLAFSELGLKPSKSAVALGPPRPEFGRLAIKKLLCVTPAPTAFVMGSSQLTLGALQALHELGLSVPNDISIVGYGDPPWFQLSAPALTTIDLPVEDLSHGAATALFRQMRDLPSASDIHEHEGLFLPTLRVRQSTKALHCPT